MIRKAIFPCLLFNMHNNGFTLLETLLVIFVMAAIILFGVNRYLYYQQRTQDVLIKNDVKIIMQALNNYYHEQGCDARQGDFQGNLSPDIVDDLKLLDNEQSRFPIVQEYSAEIEKVGETKNKRPIYNLTVYAKLAANLAKPRLKWYQHQLNAGELDKHTLSWISLPALSFAQASHAFWAMQGSREYFKQLIPVNQYSKTVSGSYCTH